MLIKIIKNTVANRLIAKAGEVLKLDPSEAKTLIAYGKAIAHTVSHKDDAVIETRPVEVETRQPVMRGRKKR